MATIPDVLRQKCVEMEDSSRVFGSSDASKTSTSYENGKILMWRGQETKYFWVSNNTGKFSIYRYYNGPEHAQIHMEHDFGKASVVNDATYFPISSSCHGVVVAVSNRSAEKHQNFLAYFALRSRNLLKCVYMQHPITCIQGVVDGTAEQDSFLQFAEQFHAGWPHILLVGCRFGYAYLIHLDIEEDDTMDTDDVSFGSGILKQRNRSEPVKSRKTVPLSKIFYEDEMFVFRSDEGTTKCLEKGKVFVSALTYIEKSKLVVVGFNFGGILIISLKTSKVTSLFYIEGSVKFFAVQEPEEDPRPILFFWVCMNVVQKGPVVILISVNFPKDEAATKDPAEYTFEDPVFVPSMKWYPDSCSRMISMRTLLIHKQKISGNGPEDLDELDRSSSTVQDGVAHDTSLMLMVWIEDRRGGTSVMHGSLFDLNAYYARRLVGRVTVDNTLAKQMHFFSRFSSTESLRSTARGLLDVCAHSIYRFAAPAFLKDSIDQLYYPSVYYITANCLSDKQFVQVKVQPIQIQLIANISDNIEAYFDEPSEPCRWVCAIGLANSVPGANSNEEKACLLRVLVHNFFPGILKLVEACSSKPESLKFIQRWAWKEVEMTKNKFDDLCSPLFAVPPLELSPSAKGFIHHARVFFKRASLTLESVSAKVADLEDEEWQNSIGMQHQATRQVRMYAYGVAFGMVYKLLPDDAINSKLFEQVVEVFTQRYEKIQSQGKRMKIHELVSEAMDAEPDQAAWENKNSEEWFPPNSFSAFLPVLLMMDVSELSKLTMLGYYCLDLETFTSNDSIRDSLFQKCCSFFMQEEFSLEVMNQIRSMWLEDKRLAAIDTGSGEIMCQIAETQRIMDEAELKWLPLSSHEEIEHARAEYLKLDYGVHKFNLNVIDKRRFNLIIEPPPPSTSEEPDFVIYCRAQCKEISQRFPWLFKKLAGLPQFVIDKHRENAIRESVEQENFLSNRIINSRKRSLAQPQIQLSIRHINGDVLENDNKTKGAPATKLHIDGSKLNGDERAQLEDSLQLFEELPLTIATPAKRQRLMLFPPTPVAQSSSSFKVSTELKKPATAQNVRLAFSEKKFTASTSAKRNVKAKDIDRINKVIQTPVSLSKGISRIPVRRAGASSRLLFSGNGETNQTPTHPASPIPTPTSILKRAQRRSRLVNPSKPRLRFATECKTEQIPSRAQKLIEEGNDTSFSTFAVLSSTESSSLSLAHLDDSLVACEKSKNTVTESPIVEVENQADVVLRGDGHNEKDQNVELQSDVDVIEEIDADSGTGLMKSMEEQDELDTVSNGDDEVMSKPPVVAQDPLLNLKDVDGPVIAQEKAVAQSSGDEKQGSADAREWVNAHLRRSSRLRSPRKIFDQKKERL